MFNKIKVILRRSVMLVLVVGAGYATFLTLSNVSVKDMSFLFHKDTTPLLYTYDNQPYRQISLENKELKHLNTKARYISSEEAKSLKTLEEAVQFRNYPKATVLATGYTAGVESTGKSPGHPEYGITYSGVKVKRDLYSTIAADLDVYPIGTILYIPGYGYGVVADKGSAIQGNKIDLFYETVDEVYEEWGKKNVSVYVVKRGDGRLTEKKLADLNQDKSLQVFRESIPKG